jgi:hypothetical protein
VSLRDTHCSSEPCKHMIGVNQRGNGRCVGRWVGCPCLGASVYQYPDADAPDLGLVKAVREGGVQTELMVYSVLTRFSL